MKFSGLLIQKGISHGWGDLQLYPHDMAKIGYLYLNEGQWDGYQILSKDWVEEATKNQISLPDEKNGYGYGWWIPSKGSTGIYEARGRGRQTILVWPEEDLVLVTIGGGFDRNELAPFLLSALKSDRSLPESLDSYKRLQESVEDAEKPPKPKPILSLPETALRISGKTYRLSPNKPGPYNDGTRDLIRLKRHIFTWILDGRRYKMPVGLDGVYRVSPDSPTGSPVALKGFWQTDNSFVLYYSEVAGPNNFRFQMTFEGEKAVVQLDDPTGLFSQLIVGKTQD